MIIIGVNPVLEYLSNQPKYIKKIFILDSINNNKIDKIVKIAKANNISIERLSRKEFENKLDLSDKSKGISQGVLAEAEDFIYSSTSEIIMSAENKQFSTIVILDEIQDPHNFGAIIRTAAAFSADGIIISEKNTVKVNYTVIKTSSGTVNNIKIAKEKNIYKTIEILKENSYKVIGTTLNTKDEISNFKFPDKNVIIFGNEGNGLRRNIIKLCDYLVKIPINKKVESLNVSVSAGMFLYEINRQRQVF
jgi:23S rRNA (guanosine2251-2'-O)-methyltransferase